MTGRRFAPVGVRPFGRLLTSYTVNEIGDSVGIVALAVLVYDRTGDVAPTAAFFIAAKFLPALLAPALIARVDQIALRRALPTIYVLEAATFAALGLIADGEFLLALVLALALVDGTLAVTGRGLTRGAVATVLQPAGLLREGNALMNLGFALASVGGAALAGLLIGTLGVGTALYVDAASFLIIAVLLAATSGLPSVEVEREPYLQRFRAGLRYARENVILRVLLIGQAIALVLFTLIIPIEVIYAKESLGTTSAGYGVLLAAWGAGIVVGSLIYLRLKHRSAFGLVVYSTLAIAVAYLGLASAGTLAIACLISVVGGAGNGVQWIAVMTALQERTPREYQARISGLLESLGAGMPGVGYLLGGAIVAAASPRTAYAVAGGGLLVLVVGALPLRTRLRGHESHPGPNGLGAAGLPLGEPVTPAPAAGSHRDR
ncbi:MAG: MFS transporter [Solirubrobacteraceae bacterium]